MDGALFRPRGILAVVGVAFAASVTPFCLFQPGPFALALTHDTRGRGPVRSSLHVIRSRLSDPILWVTHNSLRAATPFLSFGKKEKKKKKERRKVWERERRMIKIDHEATTAKSSSIEILFKTSFSIRSNVLLFPFEHERGVSFSRVSTRALYEEKKKKKDVPWSKVCPLARTFASCEITFTLLSINISNRRRYLLLL